MMIYRKNLTLNLQMPERKSFLLVIFLIIFMSLLGTILQILRIEYGWAATQSQASYITALTSRGMGLWSLKIA